MAVSTLRQFIRGLDHIILDRPAHDATGISALDAAWSRSVPGRDTGPSFERWFDLAAVPCARIWALLTKAGSKLVVPAPVRSAPPRALSSVGASDG